MDHPSTSVMKEIMEYYQEFEGIATLVDVGGATGLCLSMILKQYPNIKAINFDLPHIIRDAPSYPGNSILSLSCIHVCILWACSFRRNFCFFYLFSFCFFPFHYFILDANI